MQEIKKERGKRKVMLGTVVSNSMQKTAVVQIERLVRHPEYGKYVRRRSRYKVHDEKNECRVGDVIRFMETRRLSRDKRWRFTEFVRRAKG
jgi:small subunit ribosomal protein S17